MAHKFAELTFTPKVKALQVQHGSRDSYARMEGGAPANDRLGPIEAGFIAARDSFYVGTVGETGWPYIQHRGGPEGFVRVLDEKTIGFADYRGNRQYVSVGNLATNDRVSTFFMDYPNRTRLKLLGRVKLVGASDVDMLASLEVPAYRAIVERGFLIHVEAFDWNCTQHITPRFKLSEIENAVTGLRRRIADLEAEVERLRARA